MPDATVIDPQAIANLRALTPDDNDEFLREIVGIYLDDTPQRIAELDRSLASGDVETFVRAAHSIKGSSSNVGASALRAVAEKLEHSARAAGLGSVQDLLAAVKAEYARVQVEFASLLPPR